MGFAGKSIYYTYFYANSRTPWTDPAHSTVFSSGKVVVSDAVEIGGDADLYSVDISDTQIRFDFHDTGLFTRAAFNGAMFADKDNKVLPIVGVTLSTNMDGLTRSDISIGPDGDRVYVNWQGTSFTSDSYVTLTFQFGRNPVAGTNHNDTLHGTAENDIITGGRGLDTLYGAGGSDVFAFATGDSGKTDAQADTIFDFSPDEGDRIDLSKWDADAKKTGIQHFTFIGDARFSKDDTAELRIEQGKSETYIQGDGNGDGNVDWVIHLHGSVTLDRGDFVL
jgi:Ca2+-binding RTX toxin-like protein